MPSIVRDASDRTLLVLALVENLQREALNPLEEAEGYSALSDRFDMKQGDIAAAVLFQSARDLFGSNSSVSTAVLQALLAVGF